MIKSIKNFLKDTTKKILPDEIEYKLGITERPTMEFKVGEGLNPEQQVVAEKTVRKANIVPLRKVGIADVLKEIPGTIAKALDKMTLDKSAIGRANKSLYEGKGVIESGKELLRGIKETSPDIMYGSATEEEKKAKLKQLQYQIEEKKFGKSDTILSEDEKKLASSANKKMLESSMMWAGSTGNLTGVSNNIIKSIAKSKSAETISTYLKKVGVMDDLIEPYSKKLADITDEKAVKETLDHIAKIQNETLIGSIPEKLQKYATQVGGKTDELIQGKPLTQSYLTAKKAVAEGKTVEEFIKEQGEVVYQTSNKAYDPKLTGKEGIFTSPSEFVAKSFGGKIKNELYISPKAKILEASQIPKQFDNFDGKNIQQVQQDLAEWARKQGYDVINNSEIEKTIINPDVIKTKSQLIDIWNKANTATQVSDLSAIKNIAPETAKAVPQIPPTIPQVVEKSSSDSINKVINALKEAKPIRGQQEKLYTLARQERIAKAISAGEGLEGQAKYLAQKSQLAGEMPKVEFESLRNQIGEKEIEDITKVIQNSKNLNFYEGITAINGLSKMLDGSVPTEGELILLNKALPKELIDAVLEKRSFFEKATEVGLNLANVPRSVMASYDVSAPFRQGLFLAPVKPKRFVGAFGTMFKALVSEKNYKAINEEIYTRPSFELMKEAKLALTDLSSSLGKREEQFMSSYAEKIPIFGRGVKASGRAYTAFLNKIRADVFDDLVKDANRLGRNVENDPKLSKEIANFINIASGRGNLPNALKNSAVALNAAFFSPRLMASRLTILNPVYYITADPFVRKEALKSLFTVLGAGTTILGLAKLGGADVGTEPRSADFGKIITGNHRTDIWGGMQQYIRALAQIISGEYVSSTSGKLVTLGEGYKPLTRYDILMRQIEAKEAPLLSFATMLLKGKNFEGQDIKVSDEIVKRMIPMTIKDMYELYQEDPKQLPLGALAFFGFGGMTYKPVYGKLPPESDKKDVYNISEKLGIRARENEELVASSKLMYDELKKMPKELAKESFQNIIKENPKMAEKINDLIDDEKLGRSYLESYMTQLGVENGDRARFIFEKLNSLKTKEEKKAYYSDLIKKKVITAKVSEQITYLLSN